jgi:hypothetical protein
MLRRSFTGSCSLMLVPSTMISPEDGSTSRLIIFIVVVFPHPEGPTKTTVSPASMSIDRSSTAAPDEVVNRLDTSRNEIITSPTTSPSPASRALGGRRGRVRPAHFL